MPDGAAVEAKAEVEAKVEAPECGKGVLHSNFLLD
jgi:hypothetical protein